MADAPFEEAPEDNPQLYKPGAANLALQAGLAMAALLPVGKVAGLVGRGGVKALSGRAAQALRSGEAADRLAPAALVRGASEIPRGMFAGPVTHPEARPGIFKDPREIAENAASRWVPEDPALKEVFGVTRQDLAEMNQHGRFKGDLEDPRAYLPNMPEAKNGGSELAHAVQTPMNAQRLIDANAEAVRRHPGIADMDNWYEMAPALQALRESSGNLAPYHFEQLNKWLGSSSPGTNVVDEIRRGTAARYLAGQGKFDLWQKYGGSAKGSPERELLAAETGMTPEKMPGHAYHSSAQLPGHTAMNETGDTAFTDTIAKVPSYIKAHGHLEAGGRQTNMPVGDTHWAAAVGLDNVNNKAKSKYGAPKISIMRDMQPWWNEHVAGPLGIEAVPAQARTWGVFSGQTGVDSPIGPGKLELLARHIKNRHQQLHNQHPEWSLHDVRDRILQGKLWGIAGAGAAGAGVASHPFEHDSEDFEA